MTPYRFDTSVFGFCKGDYVRVGGVVEEILEVYNGGVHASRVKGEGCDC